MKWLRKLTILVLCLLFPSVAFAIDLGESAQIHGFLSQGYLHSTDNNFLTNNSKSGDFEFTEGGLNANWVPLDSLRLGGQVYYRKLGDYSEDEIVLDWALVEYQPADWFGVRLGKVKMPMGLFNENRDTDFVLPMVFLPQSIYDESRRDSTLSYIGGGIYGNVSTGPWGDVDYHFFTGENDYPDNSILAQATVNSLNSLIKKNNANQGKPNYNPLIPSSLNSHKRESEELYGGALVYNTALDGLRLGFSLLTAKSAVYVNGDSTPLTVSKVKSKFVLSLEYAWSDWMFVSEYGETDRKTTNAGVVTMNGPAQSWYVMLNYAPFERWTFSALYDEFYRLKDDKDGSSRLQSPDYYGWRKDIGIAARYDLAENWTLKAEYHNVDGAAMQMNVLNPDGVDRYWNYFVGKISFSF